MTIPPAAMLPRLEVFLAPLAHRQAPGGELDVDGMLEARRCEPQHVGVPPLVSVGGVHLV